MVEFGMISENNNNHFTKTSMQNRSGSLKLKQQQRIFGFVANKPNDLYEKDKESEDLFGVFRGLLILGRILGVVPVSGVFGKSHKNLQCR